MSSAPPTDRRLADARFAAIARSVPGAVEEARSAPRLGVLVMAAVLGLTVVAAAIRLAGLPGPDGQFIRDEARLSLAAVGVLRTGLPVMPTGRVYTRGLINAYLIAPSFALLGRSDFAARLPSVAAGTLLVPVLFLLGRALAGTAPGLAAASFGALAEPLVHWSRIAWLPSVFLLMFTLCVYCCYRGFVERRGGWQVAGAVVFCLALLSYEFAVLLVGGLLLYFVARVARRHWDWYLGGPTLLALAIFLGGLALFASLALALRAGTLAGPLGEVTFFVSPGLRLSGAAFYLRQLLADYYLLIAAALLGLPLLVGTRPRGTLFLAGLATLAFLVPSFAIQVQHWTRYALPVLPLLAVLSAAGTFQLVRYFSRRLHLGGPLAGALPALALLVVFGLALSGDAQADARRFQQPNRSNWLQVLRQQAVEPSDLFVTEVPTILQFYLGRADFYLDAEDYERFTYRASDSVRDVYTGAVLLNKQGDFEELIERSNPGRVVWVIGDEDRLQRELQAIDPNLWPSLLRSADDMHRTRDGWVMVKVKVPRRSGPA